ncbi:ribonuclease E/G [Asaia spathodeae]|uniref:ribonuclease E/G n=1 Tax=Asaia spathodeae TaxID=657016 RepID=UPI002FC2BB66
MKECRIAWSPGEARIAVCDGDDLIDFALWRPGMPDGYGDTHLVRVQKAAPALGGAFVTLADHSTGFLTGTHQEGALTAARVTRSAQNGKGLRLKPVSGKVPEGDTPRLVAHGPTPLEDIAARYPDLALCCDDPALMAQIPAALKPRIERVPQAFDAVLEACCDELATPQAALPNGLRATITPTPALTAIDLDDPSPDQRRQMDGFTANRNAFPALAREIFLRNLSGAILIDPAGVPLRKRPALGSFLAAAFADDPMQPKMLGATSLGLLEVVRVRGRAPLHEALASPGGRGLSALRQILRDRSDRKAGGTPVLRASLDVVRALEADPEALAQFALCWGAPLTLTMMPDYPDAYWSFAP